MAEPNFFVTLAGLVADGQIIEAFMHSRFVDEVYADWMQRLGKHVRKEFERQWRVFTRHADARFVRATTVDEGLHLLRQLAALQDLRHARAQEGASLEVMYPFGARHPESLAPMRVRDAQPRRRLRALARRPGLLRAVLAVRALGRTRIGAAIARRNGVAPGAARAIALASASSAVRCRTNSSMRWARPVEVNRKAPSMPVLSSPMASRVHASQPRWWDA